MAQHGRELASLHRIDQRTPPVRLLPRLAANAGAIVQACDGIAAASKGGLALTPAAECLLQHATLIGEQALRARREMPRKLRRTLPRLAGGEGAGEPRIYQLALELVAHTDGKVDVDNAARFLAAYQETHVLTLAELQLFPAMLRVALVEALRRIAGATLRGLNERRLANQWADRLAQAAPEPARLLVLVADMARSQPPCTRSFVAELSRRLQGQSATLAMQWLAANLAKTGRTVEQEVLDEIAQQAADQASVDNAAATLRLLGTVDWQAFVARLSHVEQELGRDPDGTYPRMDAGTRETYRRKVALLAGRSGRPELEVAQAAVALAREPRAPSAGGLDPRTRHVGHYLVGRGAPLLEERLGLAPRASPFASQRSRLLAFLGAIFVFTTLFTVAAMDRARDSALDEVLAALFTLVFSVGASQLAVALVSFIAGQLTRPRLLPRMDFRDGVPDDAQALVAVPSMLYSPADVDTLCDTLEVHFLANRDPNLRFCLLTDFADADAQHVHGDDELLALARARIDALNGRHAFERTVTTYDEDGTAAEHTQQVQPFLLLHRARRWNPQEGVWMGHERRRGKLAELTALLRGGPRTGFELMVGQVDQLHAVRYVITLDADTMLPRDAARELVATMAHPLNQAQVAPDGSRVLDGYGMLQPRMAVRLPATLSSRYEGLCAGAHGVDPRTRSLPDAYQSLFGEGSFAGKGIYDVDAYERVLGKRLPVNRILSHDLLEGCYLRSGVLADQLLYEPTPSRYSEDVGRRHRWVRGDWQIAGWLRPTVPGPDGARLPNPLTPLSRWKIFDNLRRSLVAPALTALLVISWPVIPVDWFWTAAVLAAIFVPPMVSALFNLIEKPAGVPWPQHWSNVWHNAAMSIGHAGLALVFLPYEAFVNLDAIVRTCWRMLVSRRRLLEWRPASLSRSSANLHSNARNMWFAPLLAVLCAVALQLSNPPALLLAGPFLLAWLLSPLVAWWVSLPLPKAASEIAPADARFLHKLARRSWGFFETYVTAQENWLPPDRAHASDREAVDHRTSPTHIGLSLLSNLSAWDFGYVTTGQLLARCEGALATVRGIERHRGHLFNWYDTLTLEPLERRYVSTAASGNLAGHLLALAPGLEQAADAPLVGPQAFQGIATTLDIVEEHAKEAGAGVAEAVAAMRAELGRGSEQAGAQTLPRFADRLAQLCRHAAQVAAAAQSGVPDLVDWSERLRAQCAAFLEELSELAPWAARADQYVLDSHLTRMPTLRELAGFSLPERSGDRSAGIDKLVGEGRERAAARVARLEALAQQARAAACMDFGCLYNRATRFLCAGYDVDERRLDARQHDLLASESRLASFVAIAQGQLPREHWYALGRKLLWVHHEQVLQSRHGALSDHLLPHLVMPACHGTLLDHSGRAAVRALVGHGRRAGLPRGASGLDDGDGREDAAGDSPDSIAGTPSASLLGLIGGHDRAIRNLQRMAGIGLLGRYGLHDGASAGVDGALEPTHAFSARQQGIALAALDHLLCDRAMQRRFASAPELRATLSLLQERISPAAAFRAARGVPAPGAAPDAGSPPRTVGRAVTPVPRVHLLSNGRYHVMVSSAGGGYSRWNGIDVTRWREDGTRDHWGSFCFVRDCGSGAVWSTTYQPTRVQPESFEAVFSESCASFRRHDHGIDLHTEVAVSPEDDVELRRTRVTNNSGVARTLELTSYAEVALAAHAEDAASPSLSALPLQAEILDGEDAILWQRRPRTDGEPVLHILHLACARDAAGAVMSFATSGASFTGHGNDVSMPGAMRHEGALSGACGALRDPIAAIRCRFVLEPGEAATVDFVTGAAAGRESAVQLAGKYQDAHLADRVFGLARTHGQAVLRQLDIDDASAQLYAELAAGVIYPQAPLRADPATLARNQRGKSGLWAYAVSGDLPILLLLLRDAANIGMARQLIQAHAYWRMKGLPVDLVLWYQDNNAQPLRDQLIGMVNAGLGMAASGQPGGIFVRGLDQVSPDDQLLMMSAARIVFDDADGALADQVAQAFAEAPRYGPLAPEPDVDATPYRQSPMPLPELQLFNGMGGLAPDGREYVIRSRADARTPAPWENVLANPSFGCVVSESGHGFTWNENAGRFRLTPADGDASGEAFYIRDEQSGRFWSPSALPATGSGDYITRHGFGYSTFEHAQDAIHSEMTVFVAPDAPLKYTIIRVRNDGPSLRRLSVTGYVEWVLGELRERSAMHIVTGLDADSGALFARNAFNPDLGGRVGFFYVNAQIRTVTCDRQEFVGRTRSLAHPAAMRRRRLSGRTGAALDPCAAFCAPFALRPGEERELVFVLGVGGRRTTDAAHVIETCGSSEAAHRALEKVRQHWEDVLGAVRVTTPDPALDALANGWLLYQAIANGMWSRIEPGHGAGACRFRDQLQAALAVVHAQPQLLREQLLLCAAHQFSEGDVLHWWHPPSGCGARTRSSDDYLWLPYAVAHYVGATGDDAVLSEHAPWLDGRPLNPGEQSYEDVPGRATASATLYEHCVRAIRNAWRTGPHGLPQIGSGDWNESLDMAGREGRGESIWLAWFTVDVLTRFGEVAQRHGDHVFAIACREHAVQLAQSVEEHGWDGNWYLRAFHDDGTPLGSGAGADCRIDSTAQSWSVLSGAALPERARMAMAQVAGQLVRTEQRLVQLFDPPFERAVPDPGSVRAFPPGVGWNGGQSTDAAVWVAMAFAQLGDTERAWELQRMLNPLARSGNRDDARAYAVEPYAMAGGISALGPDAGRGERSWCTTSAAWMYRLILESLLGVRLRDGALALSPLLPEQWDGFTVRYRHGTALYLIDVRRAATPSLTLDGKPVDGSCIVLEDDGEQHLVNLCIGPAPAV
ncbi:GH36-type glycosyl hydrolase domain-containing protein [Pseudoduganella sp. GCM10020061]|uniref:GH36-type glycosyl hydrolase domain-containing protein n=1 Tax=Pseudoduganella sp. GCM10020061 TaxID=3317345 RepID=UPI003633750D